MNSKIKTLLLLTIIITTIILHTEKTPIVYAYTQTGHNNLEYINWIYLKPISPKTEHLIKPPDIIELKNGEFTNIQYTIYTYQIIINNPNNNDLIDYQVKIPITYSDVGNSFIWGVVGSIRIYDQNGQELPYWVESWDSGTKDAVVWVKVPRIPAGGSITLTLESSAKYSDKSDGDAVFEFFDDFNDGVIDEKWDVSALASAIEQDGYLKTEANANTWSNLNSAAVAYVNIQGDFYAEARLTYPHRTNDLAQLYLYLEGTDGSVFAGLNDAWAGELPIYYVNVNGVGAASGKVSDTGTIVIKIWRIGDSVTARIEGEVTLEKTGTLTGTIVKLKLTNTRYRTYPGRTAEWDYVIVRKYANVEPTVKIVPYGSTTVQYTVYTHQVVVSNPNDYDLIDYQVKIPITYSDVWNNFIWIKKGSIRIYDQSGQELPYWVESWDSDAKDAVVWVKVSRIPAGGSITLTLESSFKYSDKSDGDAVFEFFDDFNDGVIDEKWDVSALASAIEQDGYLKTEANANTWSYNWGNLDSAAVANVNIQGDFYAEARLTYPHRTNDLAQLFLILDSPSGYILAGLNDAWAGELPIYYVNVNGVGAASGKVSDTGTIVIKIWRIGDSVTARVEGEVTLEKTGTLTGTIVKLKLTNSRYRTYPGRIAEWDYVFVCKYAEVEPTVKIVS